MTDTEYEAFLEDVKALKAKHLSNHKTFTEGQLKIALSTLIEGLHKAEYPEYRVIMGLLVGGKDRFCVVHEKVANLWMYDAKTGETINQPRYKRVPQIVKYQPY